MDPCGAGKATWWSHADEGVRPTIVGTWLAEILHQHDLVGGVVVCGIEEPAVVWGNLNLAPKSPGAAKIHDRLGGTSIERVEDKRPSVRLAPALSVDSPRCDREIVLQGS